MTKFRHLRLVTLDPEPPAFLPAPRTDLPKVVPLAQTLPVILSEDRHPTRLETVLRGMDAFSQPVLIKDQDPKEEPLPDVRIIPADEMLAALRRRRPAKKRRR